MSSFYTVDGDFSNSVTIEKSKFICYIKGIENEDEAKEFIAHVITTMKLPQQALGEMSFQASENFSVKEKVSACIKIVIDTLAVILQVLAII